VASSLHFHCEAWHGLKGHVWIEDVLLKGHDVRTDLLVARPWDRPDFEQQEVDAEIYRPLERESALFQLLAEVEVEKAAIQKFADRFGRLFLREYKATVTQAKPAYQTTGDPFFEWRHNILSLRHWLKVWELIRNRDSRGLIEYTSWLPEWVREEGLHDRFNPVKDFVGATYGILDAAPRDRLKAAKKCLLLGLVGSELREGAKVHVIYDSNRDSFRFEARSENLITAIWAQFAAAVVNDSEFRRCDVCRKPFELSPEVARTNRLYCSTPCRLKAYRRRIRDAVRMRKQGKSLKAIATELRSDVDTVRGWIVSNKED
jgi:hypothetical protein